jgi:hypothetical protein
MNGGGSKSPLLNLGIGMNRVSAIASLVIAFIILGETQPSFSQPMCPHWYDRAPYGSYCPGPRDGWYGARKAVRTAEDAKRILQDFFSMYDRINIKNIKEREWFFEAEILDKNNVLIDKVIVDKRTGRIRSIY